MIHKNWYDITHKIPSSMLGIWKKTMCPKGWHLFDEVASSGDHFTEHYLYCDACDLEVPLYCEKCSLSESTKRRPIMTKEQWDKRKKGTVFITPNGTKRVALTNSRTMVVFKKLHSDGETCYGYNDIKNVYRIYEF